MRRRTVDVVIALGGDGTANEVANGLLADGVHDEVPAMGVLPGGATNVFARSLGFPNDLRSAVTRLGQAIRSRRYRTINVGRVDERYFLFCAGIGLDAAIIERMERLRARGKPTSLGLTTATVLRHLFRPTWPSLQVTHSRARIRGARWVIVANSDPWTFVNSRPLRPTPQASLEAGLDIYATHRTAPLDLIRSAVQMYRMPSRTPGRGTHLTHDLDRCFVVADECVPVHIDGDFLGRRREVDLRSVPGALRVVTPLLGTRKDIA